MAILTAAQRRKIPAREFALPKLRKLPIHDMGHTQAAYGRAAMMRNDGTITDAQYKEARARIAKRRVVLTGGKPKAKRTVRKAAPKRAARAKKNPTEKKAPLKRVTVIGANPALAPKEKKPMARKRTQSPAQRRATLANLKKARAARKSPETKAARSRAAKKGARKRTARSGSRTHADRVRSAKKAARTRKRNAGMASERSTPGYKKLSAKAKSFAKSHPRAMTGTRRGKFVKHGTTRKGYLRKPGYSSHNHGAETVLEIQANPTGYIKAVAAGVALGGLGFGVADVIDRVLATRANQKRTDKKTGADIVVTGKDPAVGTQASILIAEFSVLRTGVSAAIGAAGIAGAVAMKKGSWARLILGASGFGAATKAGADLVVKKFIPWALGGKGDDSKVSKTGKRLFPGEIAIAEAQKLGRLPGTELEQMDVKGLPQGVGECPDCATQHLQLAMAEAARAAANDHAPVLQDNNHAPGPAAGSITSNLIALRRNAS